MSNASSPPCLFLDKLPGEIRSQIYRAVFRDSYVEITKSSTDKNVPRTPVTTREVLYCQHRLEANLEHSNHEILETCHQIQAEAKGVFDSVGRTLLIHRNVMRSCQLDGFLAKNREQVNRYTSLHIVTRRPILMGDWWALRMMDNRKYFDNIQNVHLFHDFHGMTFDDLAQTMAQMPHRDGHGDRTVRYREFRATAAQRGAAVELKTDEAVVGHVRGYVEQRIRHTKAFFEEVDVTATVVMPTLESSQRLEHVVHMRKQDYLKITFSEPALKLPSSDWTREAALIVSACQNARDYDGGYEPTDEWAKKLRVTSSRPSWQQVRASTNRWAGLEEEVNEIRLSACLSGLADLAMEAGKRERM